MDRQEPTENPEKLYGLAWPAFVITVMLGVVVPALLMVAGLHWGFKVTW